MSNPNPGQITNEMWAFWLAFKKLEPTVKLGGIYANKSGYHNTRDGNKAHYPGDYSYSQIAADRQGPGNKSAAIDLTLPLPQMKKYSARLLKSGRDMKDIRGNYLREFYGNVDGNQYVDGWDFQSCVNASSDDSHLWHIHISFIRKYVTDAKAFRAVLSILKGESFTTWKLKEAGQTVIQVITKKPAPKPAPKPVKKPVPRYHTVKPGNNATNIAKAYDISLATLKKLNPNHHGSWDDIAVGEKLRVR